MKENKEMSYLGKDNFCNKYTADCALMAAGATIECCEQVFLFQTCDSAFALVRPPGHHADANTPSGFCLLNNVAIGAKYLLDNGCARVCIFDWDVHCGDGTSRVFYEEDRVMYVSIHRLWEGRGKDGWGGVEQIGEGKGKGYTIHYGYEGNKEEGEINDSDYIYACESVLFPRIHSFAPEAILISAGFDIPDLSKSVTPSLFAFMTYGLLRICPRIVAVLEGGYNLKMLPKCVEAVVKAMMLDPDDEEGFRELMQGESYEEIAASAREQVKKEFVNVSENINMLLLE